MGHTDTNQNAIENHSEVKQFDKEDILNRLRRAESTTTYVAILVFYLPAQFWRILLRQSTNIYQEYFLSIYIIGLWNTVCLGYITYFWVQHHNGRASFEGKSHGSFNSTICILCNKNLRIFDCVMLVNMFEIVRVKIIQCTFKIKKKVSWRLEASAALSSAHDSI